DGERRVVADRLDGAVLDHALHAEPAVLVTAGPGADLVDVAVVVDRRAQELRDDHPAGDEHEPEHDERQPAAAAAPARGGGVVAGAGGEVGHVQYLSASSTLSAS